MLAVSTGIDSFLNPQDIGPLYPFVGAEVLLSGVALFLWLAWHFLQGRGESREHRDACAMYADVGLDRAMYHGASALMATEEEWAGHGRKDGEGGGHSPQGPDDVTRTPDAPS